MILETRGFEEVVLHLDGDERARRRSRSRSSPTAGPTGGSSEVRIYYSSWPLTGRHANRPPVLQPDPDLRESDVVAEYQRALAAGDVDAIVAAFEPDGYAREPAAAARPQRSDGLRAFYERLFSNGGGIPLEHCALIDDGRALRPGVQRRAAGARRELPPQAGVAVFVRGESGKLAAARIYDDADPPLGHRRPLGLLPRRPSRGRARGRRRPRPRAGRGC